MSVKNVKSNPIIYGLTGGIASGKSTASKYLQNKGLKVFDSDAYVAKLWNNSILINDIKSRYNIDLKETGAKKKLAKLMFTNKDIKEDIENLIHPLVFDAIDRWIKENFLERQLIIDMPLLYEVGYNDKVDTVIVIYANSDLQVKRLVKRDNLSVEDALLRINSQMDIEKKKAKANIIIDNTKDISNLYKQLDHYLGVDKGEN